MQTPAPPVTELAALDLAPYSAAQIRFAGAAWPMRAAEELRSALIFRALTRAARDAGMPEPWPTRFASAVRDELRHARLCAALGERLRVEPPGTIRGPCVRGSRACPSHGPGRPRSCWARSPSARRSPCVCSARRERPPSSRSRARCSRRSSATKHATSVSDGRASLACGTCSRRQRARRHDTRRRGAWARASAEITPALQWLQKRLPFDPAYAALGVLDPEVRVETFYFAVERLVLPRLTRLGIDGPTAWQNRYRAARD